MVEYILRRLVLAFLTVLAITVISFAIIQAPPGDYVTAYVTTQAASGNEIRQQEAENLRELYGLNQPIYIQYAKWMNQVMRGRFGMSMNYNRPVDEVIGDRLWLTIFVSLAAIIFTWVVALPIGIYSATHQYSPGDYIATFIGFIGLAIPGFLLALIIMYVGFRYFNTNIGGLFSAEYVSAPWSPAKVFDMLKHMVIPAIVLGLSGTASMIRIMRANLLDELHKPYVVTARAKGLPVGKLINKYPVRVAFNPFISTLGYLFPYVVSGSIIVSLVLGLPTVGPLLLQSLVAQDMYLAGTIILMLGIMTVIGTFVSDMLLMWIDPRIRLEGR